MFSKASRLRVKAFLPQFLIDEFVRTERGVKLFRDFRGRHQRECPICTYVGPFWAGGRQPMVFDATCPRCRSIGRHRQHFLLISRNPSWIDTGDVLHFAPEACFDSDYAARVEASGHAYVRADYMPTAGETKVDIQQMQFADDAFDTIICHNVLEHVPDDRRALSEMHRILRPGGRALLSVPMVDAWDETYEDGSITSDDKRDLYFNQFDHYRLYGRDFYDRVRGAGFSLQTYVAREPEVSRYGLERGETIFIASK